MAPRVLLIEVGLLDDRWHGVGDWPPSPMRLFQALVAGAYGGRWVAEDAPEATADKDAAFQWLERLAPPRIVAPPRLETGSTVYFVPNNDLDAVGGDPRRVAEIRAAKPVAPSLLERGASFLYAFDFEDGEAHAERLCTLAERLHLFGRGVDAAFARAEVLDAQAAEARLSEPGWPIRRPTSALAKDTLPCPADGSLHSLKVRHAHFTGRFSETRVGRKRETAFRQPPKPQQRPVAYDRAPARLFYELRHPLDLRRYAPVSQGDVRVLAERLRDAAAARLKRALPELEAAVELCLVGRGAGPDGPERRVRVLPLPSIGAGYVSPSVRRVMVEVAPDCPLARGDVAWAFDGLELHDPTTGEILAVVAPAVSRTMSDLYGFDIAARTWRTVTPLALPRPQARGQRGGARVSAEREAVAAITASLRHAGLDARLQGVLVQREPFARRGVRADEVDAGRFDGRLTHAEVIFDRPVAGPLVLGDGRFVGLGLMRPVQEPPRALHLFALDPKPPVAAAEALARALRRAVMARAQAVVGEGRPLPALFTGHAEDGAPLRTGRHEHLAFLAEDTDGDGRLDRLAVLAPDLLDRTVHTGAERLAVLEATLADLHILRAGRAGAPRLHRLAMPGEDDPVFGRSATWTSRTPYRPTRHPKRAEEIDAHLREDLAAECGRRGLPRPEVRILKRDSGPRGGLAIQARLVFPHPAQGPLLLGVGSHAGAGLFVAARG